MRFVRRLEDLGRDDVGLAGGKGANLGDLVRAGLPVPPGVVLTTAAYQEFVAATGIGPQVLALAELPPEVDRVSVEERAARIRELFSGAPMPAELEAEVRQCGELLGDVPLAVRSSATAEDLAGASFAGQQETFLNVRGPAALVTAVRACWASLWTARAMQYRDRQGIEPASVALAVVVQQLVDADSAGVLFTVDPTTGRRDTVLVSAGWGLGESVVGGTVTTDDLVVDKATGAVRSRTTADKAVLTATVDGGTEEQPVPAARRTAAVLDDDAAAALTALGRRIEEHFGAPQDVEWARAGDAFWIVQSRPITALPEPDAEPPTDWPVPDPHSYYFRASIVEQLPDPLSPLFAEFAQTSVPRTLRAFLRDALGRDIAAEKDIGFPTVNGYAYYRYTRRALWRMTALTPLALRLFSANDARVGPLAWREQAHPRYRSAVHAWTARPLGGVPTAELVDGVRDLIDAATRYYTSVQTIIPFAVTTEVMFTQFYERLVRRAGDPPATTFLLGFDSAPIRAEQSLYDVAAWTRAPGRERLAAALSATPTAQLVTALDSGEPPTGLDGDDEALRAWPEWRSRVRAHLDRFGHAVYNLDVVNAVAADDPSPLLDTLRFYLAGSGADPRDRQAASAARRDAATAAVLVRLDPLRRRIFARLVGWAQAAAPVREDALADIGLAWPQLRRMLREVGERLVRAGVVDDADDVYWLHTDEILAEPAGSLGDVVRRRRVIWRGQRRVTPPQVLPQHTWWDRFDSLMPAVSHQADETVLTGTGASGGQITATARVLNGPTDFGRMRGGDVLVAGITTPAWTPLFAMASAVVTDVGGPLSHSSIVAREYGIPAVLGTGVATRRIRDGALVRVDGDAGTVTLLDDAPTEAPTEAPTGPPTRPVRQERWRRTATALVGAAAAVVVTRAATRRRRAKKTAIVDHPAQPPGGPPSGS